MKTLNTAMGKLIQFLHLYQNIVIGVIAIIISAIMLIAAADIKVIASSLTAVDNAAFLPRLVSGIMILVGLALIVRGIREIKANRETMPQGEILGTKAHETLRSLGALTMLLIYIICFNTLGFVISSILFMVALMFYMTKKEDWKPVLFVIIAVAMTLIVYFCFKKFLYIYLPNGILKGVF